MRRAAAAGRTHPPVRAWELPRDLSSPGRARALTRTTVAGWGIDPDGDYAAVLVTCVSEVVTNAVTHGAGQAGFTLAHTGDAVACRVHDDGPMRPLDRNNDEHGRGLAIVTRLAETFAVIPDENGKTVTFQIPIPRKSHETGPETSSESTIGAWLASSGVSFTSR
jgi:anti-sigma regulatory factor (Ser/Thr protein kinase)